MLNNLHIENYALIRESDICFTGGFVAITGETGAGKSIMLGALALVLGQRADTQVLSDKERKCIVEATFDIRQLQLQPFFEANELDYDDQLVLRREILPSGKSRAFVNDSPVQLPLLKELGTHLIDIHSQHETLTLGSSSFQLGLLDTLSNAPVAQYGEAYRTYSEQKHHLEQLMAQEAQNRKEGDYKQFLFDELQQARLVSGEQEELEEELQLLEHTESIKESLGGVAELCDGEEDSALSRINSARGLLSRITSYHKDVAALSERLDSSLIELRDILSEVASLNDALQYSPQRQEQVSERLDLIYRLEKKHGVDSIDALLQIRDQLDAQLQGIQGLDEQIHETMEAVDRAYQQLQQQAERLTACRTQAARQVEQQILPTLAALGMAEARLQVPISPAADYGRTGHDEVLFLFNANRGSELRELSKVASGGELSRLMLAIKSMITQRSLLPTIIFDEIDTGVSGDIALSVAGIMQDMASRMQVIAITHLPQIAARAQLHFKVYKVQEDTRTVSQVVALTPEQRVHEVAVMLSSEPPTAAALRTAQELME